MKIFVQRWLFEWNFVILHFSLIEEKNERYKNWILKIDRINFNTNFVLVGRNRIRRKELSKSP